MKIKLNSTAPHICPAIRWEEAVSPENQRYVSRDEDSASVGLALHLDGESQPEMGIRRFAVGLQPLAISTDLLCHFMTGKGIFHSDAGEEIEIEPQTVVHFKEGWSGQAEISETADATYMRFEGGPAGKTPVLRNSLTAEPLIDRGPVSKPLIGHSRTAGILLSREADGKGETGIWSCTPGTWRCVVKRDEFCHFIAGSSTYRHDEGEVIEVKPDTLAFFPRGWSGECQVHDTVRKVYVIR